MSGTSKKENNMIKVIEIDVTTVKYKNKIGEKDDSTIKSFESYDEAIAYIKKHSDEIYNKIYRREGLTITRTFSKTDNDLTDVKIEIEYSDSPVHSFNRFVHLKLMNREFYNNIFFNNKSVG